MDREYIGPLGIPGQALVSQREYDSQKRAEQMKGLIQRAVAPQQQNPNVGIKQEYTGGSVNYYKVLVKQPTNRHIPPYEAECNDIIEALGMNYAEGNAFKAIWRSCAARNLGIGKEGYKDGKYDAEKVVFFGQRMVKQFESK